MNRALVVGGGFGGIASAIRLRAKGYEVELLDRCPRLGGRAQVFERDGFRFDAGPTVITAPFLFDELFELHGRRREDYVEFRPLDPWYRFQFSDGDIFDYGGEIEDTEAEISRFNAADVEGYRRLVAHSEKIFDVGFTELSDRPFHKVATMLAQIPALLKLKCYRTVWQMVCAYL